LTILVITFSTLKKKKNCSNAGIALQMSMPRQCWVPYITLNTCITMNCCLELINIVFVSRLWSWSKTSIYVWVLPDNHDWPIISVNILNKISQFEISIYPLQLQSFEKFVFRVYLWKSDSRSSWIFEWTWFNIQLLFSYSCQNIFPTNFHLSDEDL
jgi:hypothetical protein